MCYAKTENEDAVSPSRTAASSNFEAGVGNMFHLWVIVIVAPLVNDDLMTTDFKFIRLCPLSYNDTPTQYEWKAGFR
jgi:hypothetical protein